MILNNTPNHEAILSNVGEIGEFRIRNSAKAFSILSSGLYANKIRAIVRELSCNAVDSHVAAGCTDRPFDVHLPTAFEPWFAIRDYGVGLSHDQVTRIYTTYFESTKTGSNDFIGALGLGSKSPFSYTDNFTVTAVQGGVRGIYSAFINGDGVPSIALMSTDTTDEPNGVEIKFSVNDQYDCSKFRDEAKFVYRYFSLRPKFNTNLEIPELTYATRDIIPGVHEYDSSSWHYGSVAVMGNIAYPIDVPNAITSLGKLAIMLECSLEIHFDIGELDFQASREGLSYIPQTIDAIKRKLEAVNAALTVKLAEDLDKTSNLWERAKQLDDYSRRKLWNAAAVKYVTDTKFPLYTPRIGLYGSYTEFELSDGDLINEYNAVIKSFYIDNGYTAGPKVVNTTRGHGAYKIGADANGMPQYAHGWKIPANPQNTFVVNDTKKGVLERAKYHFKLNTKRGDGNSNLIYVLEPHDRSKPMKSDALLKRIMNPPLVINASTMAEKKRKTLSRDVTIMQLERRDNNYRRNSDNLVWRDAGGSDDFDKNTTFYYLPLTGYVMSSKYGWTNSASSLGTYLKSVSIGDLNKITIYGVRKADIEAIQSKKNWVNLEDHIVETLKKFSSDIIDTVLSKSLDDFEFAKYNSNNTTNATKFLNAIVDPLSLYKTFVNKVAGFKRLNIYDIEPLKMLITAYCPDITDRYTEGMHELINERNACYNHYPLLKMLEHSIGRTSFDVVKMADYINMIDSQAKK